MKTTIRSSKGASIAEFAPAFTIFILSGIVPLVMCLVVPVKICIMQALLEQSCHRLARSEKMSTALATLNSGSDFDKALRQCGVNTKSSSISIIAGNLKTQRVFQMPAPIDPEWLPGGRQSDGVCMMELSTNIQIAAICPAKGIGIPGVTIPLNLRMTCKRNWENMSCDPESRQYYINE